ncbi:hypothetical protein L083_3226 [Actinoplanes sp. N902-109]|nr:hypothetical protein L083_3226 [Actinoplanes sp. N902-109]
MPPLCAREPGRVTAGAAVEHECGRHPGRRAGPGAGAAMVP